MNEKIEIKTTKDIIWEYGLGQVAVTESCAKQKWVAIDALKQKLQDLFDTMPIEMQKVGRRYEVFSIGTKKQWILWFIKYDELFSLLEAEQNPSVLPEERK